ncbi:MAG TPA: carbohydrate ABC transporter permease [Chloroflexota bacterium]|nr:carbohydrate ABC transporter permease [Chloroflexota bacterium]
MTTSASVRLVRRLVLVVGLGFFTLWTLFPIYWIVSTSLKPNAEIYGDAALWPRSLTFIHFDEIFNQTRFGTYFRNSLEVSVLTTVCAMAIGVLAAYALTRLTFTGRTFVARSVIVTYLVPGSLLFIPVFQLAYTLGLTDKALGLVVVYLIGTVPFCTWLAISYFNTIPHELEDAAMVDGANRLQSLLFIILPLALPALAVIALFAFTNSWNEFLFALLLIGRDSEKTIPAGLAGLINGDVFQWGALMAGALITALPPVAIYVLAQRWVVSGLASGAVKH